MNAEPTGMDEASRPSNSERLNAEQVQQVLRTRPDALQSYLVATRPKTWHRSLASSFLYMGGSYLFMMPALWAEHLARTGRPTSAVYCFLGALVFPLLAIVAYFDARRTAQGLTTDLKYREILRDVIWGKLSGYLGVCYFLILLVLGITGNLYPSSVFK